MKRTHLRDGLLACAMVSVGACSPAPHAAESKEPSTPQTAPPQAAPSQSAPAESAATLEVHMRDHLNFVTQARDALIRGRVEAAQGALTWMAHRRDPSGLAHARPFLDRLQQHARRGVDSSDLPTASDAIGAIATTCGECHEVFKGGPTLEPSGMEDLDDALTVETHMHRYLWATETLWNALVADPALWRAGVNALAELTPPSKPRALAPGFAAVAAWTQSAASATTFVQRGQAFGQLITTCGNCHRAHGVDPAAVP